MINAVISEFNPFHNGHRYLINTAKQMTGNPYTLSIMSGNFVQRGQPAIADKHTRAAAAVRCGVDLVLQIPTSAVLGSAQIFAGQGVFIAKSLGLPVSLCFGSEADDISPLLRLAEIDTVIIDKLIKERLSSKIGYAKAVMDAYSALSKEDAQYLLQPNNLLAFEYIKAAKAHSDIQIVNIKREGVSHDSERPQGDFASAGYIRDHIDDADIHKYLPEPVQPQIDKIRFETVLLHALKQAPLCEIAQIAGVDDGLENRIHRAAERACSIEQYYALLKTKRYTLSRLRRCSISVLLKNTKACARENAPFLKVLAFNDNGRDLLARLKKTALIPIITKPADAKKIPLAMRYNDLEARACDIYNFVRLAPIGSGKEFTHSPVYISSSAPQSFFL